LKPLLDSFRQPEPREFARYLDLQLDRLRHISVVTLTPVSSCFQVCNVQLCVRSFGKEAPGYHLAPRYCSKLSTSP
jgi:hypothetical protein